MVLRVALAALLLVACGTGSGADSGIDPRCPESINGYAAQPSPVPNECAYLCGADAGPNFATCPVDAGPGLRAYVCTNGNTRENCGGCGVRCTAAQACTNRRCVP
jgi:hypothetical protein